MAQNKFLDLTGLKTFLASLKNTFALKTHSHTKSQITDFPTALKNPTALTFTGNVSGTYDGSSAKTINITPSSIGAAASSHTHNYAGSSSAGGAANSAVKLATARTINNVSFDGTKNITIEDATKSDLLPSASIQDNEGSAKYYKLFTISPTSSYLNSVFKIDICGRRDNVCTIEVNVTSSADKYMNGNIKYYGDTFAKNNIKGYLFKNTTSQITTLEVWMTLNAWDDVKFFQKTSSIRGVSFTWNMTKGTALPTNATTVLTPIATTWVGTHSHNYAGSSSSGGSANSAVKLDTSSAGSATQPVYFNGGKPTACSYTLGKSVPSNAVFTDTTYGTVSASANGLMTPALYNKLNGIADGANKYTHPSYVQVTAGLYKIGVDNTGHVTYCANVTKADITALGIPGQDTNTTYGVVTSSANGLMSTAMLTKLNGISDGANKYTHPAYTARSAGLYKTTVDSQGHVSNVASVTKADITALGIPSSDTWRGIQNNLTSTSTTDSLSAAQGKALNDKLTGHTHSTLSFTGSVTGSYNGSADKTVHVPVLYNQTGSNTNGCLTQDAATERFWNNHLLWSGNVYPTASQVVNFNATASNQSHGIVLVFSGYDPDTSSANDLRIQTFFVPKHSIETFSGKPFIFQLGSEQFSYVGAKFLYISNNKITGSATNNATGTGGCTTKYANNRFSLRYVIGV